MYCHRYAFSIVSRSLRACAEPGTDDAAVSRED
jgi:hypothetical protein